MLIGPGSGLSELTGNFRNEGHEETGTKKVFRQRVKGQCSDGQSKIILSFCKLKTVDTKNKIRILSMSIIWHQNAAWLPCLSVQHHGGSREHILNPVFLSHLFRVSVARLRSSLQ